MTDTDVQVRQQLDQMQAAIAELLRLAKRRGRRPAAAKEGGLETVPAPAVARRMGVSMKAFNRNYAAYFTDARPAALRGARRRSMLIPADEVEAWFSGLPDGAAAVANLRIRLGRVAKK